MILMHAYGPADDTPGHLSALAGDDPDARKAALAHLWSAVIHQGTPWTVTASAARTVAALIGDPRLAGDAELRANLLNFLAAVADAGRSAGDVREYANPEGVDVEAATADEIGEDEVLMNALYARSVLGCQEVTPVLLAAATVALSDDNPEVRAAAAHLVGTAAADGSLAERLDALAATAGPDERAALVLAIGELGGSPRAYLEDNHPGVRACAALAPTLADDPAATTALLAALPATDDWFTHRPPQLHTHIRFPLVNAAIARIPDRDRLLPAALAIAGIATAHTVDFDWGPLLRAFFEDYAAGPLTPAQHAYLDALVDNPNLWKPAHGNTSLAFRAAGLPYDRDACRALIAAT